MITEIVCMLLMGSKPVLNVTTKAQLHLRQFFHNGLFNATLLILNGA